MGERRGRSRANDALACGKIEDKDGYCRGWRGGLDVDWQIEGIIMMWCGIQRF